MLVEGIFGTLHERPEDHRSCIVYQNVETSTEGATENMVDGRDQLIDSLDGAEIGAHGLCGPACIADFLDDLFCTRGTCRVVDNDASTIGGQTDSDSSSDSARRPGDECKFVLQWPGNDHSPIWIMFLLALNHGAALLFCASLIWLAYRMRFTFARSIISSPYPLRTALRAKRPKPFACSKVMVGGITRSSLLTRT